MNKQTQNLKGLEAAYLAVYNRPLMDRVSTLVKDYGDRVDLVHCELNPENPVPCFWKVSELAEQYAL